MNLTSKLSKSGALVILASRKRERWLMGFTGRELRKMCRVLLGLRSSRHTTPPASFDTSDTGGESKQPSNRTRLEGVYENLRSTDCGDRFLPILLAPFMGALPTKDLLTISCIWSTRVAKVLGKSAATRLVRTVLDSDSPYRDNTELTEEARVYIETLMNAAEVAEPDGDLALSSTSVLLHKDVEFSEPSSPAGSFLTTIGKKWPWDCWEDHREWGVVDAEIELEFDNFASACMTGLLHIDLDITHLMGLMRIAAVLEHGACDKFYYRKTILAQVWTVALAKTLTELRELQDEGRSRQTDIYMFLLTATYFSSEIGRFHDLDRESDEVAKYKGLIAQFAVLASRIVPENIEVKAKKHKLSG
ncbi:hypothetical protein FCOIX_9185 [Fusarium coicis]|nr:hypothetical protein FCOIX_9185 [Fusarium coicis]